MQLQMVAAIVLAAFSAVPVAAQALSGSVAPASGAKPASKADPNKSVCRTIDTTGSRLGKRRECRTASEWAEQRALDRREVERQQASRWKSN